MTHPTITTTVVRFVEPCCDTNSEKKLHIKSGYLNEWQFLNKFCTKLPMFYKTLTSKMLHKYL